MSKDELRVSECCLTGGACFEAGLSEVCHTEPVSLVARLHGRADFKERFGEMKDAQLFREAAQAIEAQRAETAQTGSVHESAVVADDAPKGDA